MPPAHEIDEAQRAGIAQRAPFDRFDLGHDPVALMDEDIANRGRLGPGPTALEQDRAQTILGIMERTGKRRLRQAHGIGRIRQPPPFRQGADDPDMTGGQKGQKLLHPCYISRLSWIIQTAHKRGSQPVPIYHPTTFREEPRCAPNR